MIKKNDHATLQVGSDSYPYTVSRVSTTGKTIWLKRDNYEALPDSNYYGNQKYKYMPDENAMEVKAFKTTEENCFKGSGGRFYIGYKRAYSDPSF